MFTTLGATFLTTGAKLVAALTVGLKGASCTFNFGGGEPGRDLGVAALVERQSGSATINTSTRALKVAVEVSLCLMQDPLKVTGARVRAG